MTITENCSSKSSYLSTNNVLLIDIPIKGIAIVTKVIIKWSNAFQHFPSIYPRNGIWKDSCKLEKKERSPQWEL